MALNLSPVLRNLDPPIIFLGLEVEDFVMVGILGIAAMLFGQFCFSDEVVFGLPMNWALLLVSVPSAVLGLVLLKYGKPRGYTMDLLNWVSKPRAFSGMESSDSPVDPYLNTQEAE